MLEAIIYNSTTRCVCLCVCGWSSPLCYQMLATSLHCIQVADTLRTVTLLWWRSVRALMTLAVISIYRIIAVFPPSTYCHITVSLFVPISCCCWDLIFNFGLDLLTFQIRKFHLYCIKLYSQIPVASIKVKKKAAVKTLDNHSLVLVSLTMEILARLVSNMHKVLCL